MNFSAVKSICFLVGIIAIMAPISNGARICVVNVNQNCNSNVNACGRFGGSNLCMRFQNTCGLNQFNCGSSTYYSPVNISYCRGIGVNQRRTCNGLSSTTNNGIPSGLGYGSYGYSNSNQPIIVRV